MSQWPTGWREHTLRAAQLQPTQFMLDVLKHWEASTPTARWTNNPLGIPSHGYGAPRAFNSPYAAFPTMRAFYDAFAKAAHNDRGKPLFTMLGTQEKHSEAWRVIHKLGWPGNETETDYPAKLLDVLTDDALSKLKISKPSERKTVGIIPDAADQHAIVQAQSAALHHATQHINDASRAIGYVIQRLGRNG